MDLYSDTKTPYFNTYTGSASTATIEWRSAPSWAGFVESWINNHFINNVLSTIHGEGYEALEIKIYQFNYRLLGVSVYTDWRAEITINGQPAPISQSAGGISSIYSWWDNLLSGFFNFLDTVWLLILATVKKVINFIIKAAGQLATTLIPWWVWVVGAIGVVGVLSLALGREHD